MVVLLSQSLQSSNHHPNQKEKSMGPRGHGFSCYVTFCSATTNTTLSDLSSPPRPQRNPHTTPTCFPYGHGYRHGLPDPSSVIASWSGRSKFFHDLAFDAASVSFQRDASSPPKPNHLHHEHQQVVCNHSLYCRLYHSSLLPHHPSARSCELCLGARSCGKWPSFTPLGPPLSQHLRTNPLPSSSLQF
jgi:hypothetical protein